MAIFEGAGVAIVTPFKENGEVNYEKLDELLEEQIANHTDCIVVTGTTGESATMTEEEHVDVIRFTCERVKGRIPVVAGTGSNCTHTAMVLSKEAEEAGADGVLLVSPYYNKATQNGLKPTLRPSLRPSGSRQSFTTCRAEPASIFLPRRWRISATTWRTSWA